MRGASAGAVASIVSSTACAILIARAWLRRRRHARMREKFERDGFLLLPGFASAAECESMMATMRALIDETPVDELTSVFRTDGKQSKAQGSDDYFMTSADKVRFFLEPGAVDERGALRVPKERAINKVGHALHTAVPAFIAYTQGPKVRDAVHALGWRAPDLVQSMYIFKQPEIGGEVTPHQDSAFMRTEPLSCLGLWLALQDASLTNGCLWARPGSHKEPLRRHFRREVDPATGRERMAFANLLPADAPAPPAAAWDGKPLDAQTTPASLGFVPLPACQGDLVLIHGQVDHLSMPNTSSESRHTFQLHLVEGPGAGTQWDRGNWIAYPEGKPFPTFA